MSAMKTVKAINWAKTAGLIIQDKDFHKRDRKEQIAFMDEMIEAAQSAKKELQALAIEQGLATYAEGKPSELPPTKDLFIELYGREEFDKVKRIGKPRQYFVWND